jgi:hypothetical protein
VKKSIALNIAILVFIISLLGATLGCDNLVRGGAEIWLEDVSVGSFSMDGKPIMGLPTQKISAVLKVSSNKIYVKSTSDGVVIRLSPSNATITYGSGGMTITGLEPDQVELKFQTEE